MPAHWPRTRVAEKYKSRDQNTALTNRLHLINRKFFELNAAAASAIAKHARLVKQFAATVLPPCSRTLNRHNQRPPSEGGCLASDCGPSFPATLTKTSNLRSAMSTLFMQPKLKT